MPIVPENMTNLPDYTVQVEEQYALQQPINTSYLYTVHQPLPGTWFMVGVLDIQDLARVSTE